MGIELWLFEGGYLFQHIATFFQILKMKKRQNSECVSLETNILFLIGALSRIGWMWDSMLKTFTLTYLEIFLAIGTLSYAIYLYQINKVRNYYSNVIQLPIYLKLYVLIPIIVILSFLFNPGDNWFSSQFFVAFGIFSEALGLIPQSELYIVFLGIARFFRLFFWIYSYIDGNNFTSLMIADVIHTIALSNFIYNVIKNWSGNGLPTSFSELSGNSPKKMF